MKIGLAAKNSEAGTTAPPVRMPTFALFLRRANRFDDQPGQGGEAGEHPDGREAETLTTATTTPEEPHDVGNLE